MTKGFKEFDAVELKEGVFPLFDKDWMLVTAGTVQSFNTMAASR